MDWSIQDWGALGEILGAFGVIVTLVYLTLNMRQNTKALNLQTAQAVFHQSYEQLSRNKGLREFWENNRQLFTKSFQAHVAQTLTE